MRVSGNQKTSSSSADARSGDDRNLALGDINFRTASLQRAFDVDAVIDAAIESTTQHFGFAQAEKKLCEEFLRPVITGIHPEAYAEILNRPRDLSALQHRVLQQARVISVLSEVAENKPHKLPQVNARWLGLPSLSEDDFDVDSSYPSPGRVAFGKVVVSTLQEMGEILEVERGRKEAKVAFMNLRQISDACDWLSSQVRRVDPFLTSEGMYGKISRELLVSPLLASALNDGSGHAEVLKEVQSFKDRFFQPAAVGA